MVAAPESTESTRRLSTRARVGLGVASLAIAAALTAVATIAISNNRDSFNQDDDVFDLGNTGRIAGAIDGGGPILLADPLGRGRPIWVNHLGNDVAEGWVAFSALAPEGGEVCQVTWDAEAEEFADCQDRRYPEDGTGLDQFVVDVDGSVVSIDLNFAERDEPFFDDDDDGSEP